MTVQLFAVARIAPRPRTCHVGYSQPQRGVCCWQGRQRVRVEMSLPRVGEEGEVREKSR